MTSVYITKELLDSKKTVKFVQGVKKVLHTDNVFLFVPNIIDYLRLVMILSFGVNAMYGNYVIAAVSYVINFALDEVDGNSARFLGQTSIFGMLLDIFLDEWSIVFLGMTLSILYPHYVILFQLYSAIDFTAQWSNYQFAALYRNNNYASSDDWLIKTYFNNYCLTLLWVYGNHIFLLMLYLVYYTNGPMIAVFGLNVGLWKLIAYLSAPWSVSRLGIMLYLLISSMRNIGEQDKILRMEKKAGISESTANQIVASEPTTNQRSSTQEEAIGKIAIVEEAANVIIYRGN